MPCLCCSPSIRAANNAVIFCERINLNIIKEFSDKGVPTVAHFLSLCAVDAVRQFRQPNGRQNGTLVTRCSGDLFKQFDHFMAASFGSDDHA
jgi:hypothetical protein